MVRGTLAALVVLLCLTSCENGNNDEIEGVRFSNDSSRNVDVWAYSFMLMLPNQRPSFTLAPGDEKDVNYKVEKIYYDWQPKETVAANQVEDNHIIFVDK